MNKKFIAILMCLILLLSFGFGCNDPEGNGGDNSTGNVVEKNKDNVKDIDLIPDTAGKHDNTLQLYDSFYDLENPYSFFEDTYVNTPFYSDSNDYITYLCNALWDIFGTNSQLSKNVTDRAKNNLNVIDRPLGINSAWLGIDSYKTAWYSGTLKLQAKAMLKKWPQRADGYLWSWKDSETWGGPGYSDSISGYLPTYHFDQQFEWINGVAEICLWEGDTDFLDEIDETACASVVTPDKKAVDNVSGKYTYYYNDVSEGMTIRQKLQSAVAYIMRPESSTNSFDNDPLTGKFYKGMNAYDSANERFHLIRFPVDNRYAEHISSDLSIAPAQCLGAPGSGSANIWDDMPFGWYSPYECALYLRTLESLVNIYTLDGDVDTANIFAKALEDCKVEYDQKFWSNDTGRYITNVSNVYNLNGSGSYQEVNLDIGTPFVGYMALFAGAGDTTKAETFFDWIDGDRVVQSDINQGGISGNDIVDMYKFATITNTVPLEYTPNVIGGKWWHAPGGLDIGPGNIGEFGKFLENGGAIFYTTFYENMARIKYGLVDSALDRMTDVAKEYDIDGLDRDNVRIDSNGKVTSMKVDGTPIGTSGVWIGCAGEYPENGLVPLIYLRGFMGINAKGDGLYIEPSIPEEFGDMGCKQIDYKGNVLNVHIYRDDCIYVTPNNSGKAMVLNVSDFISGDGDYYASVDGEEIALTENANGTFKLQLANGFRRVKIYKK